MCYRGVIILMIIVALAGIFSASVSAQVIYAEPGSPANSIYINSDGNIGIGGFDGTPDPLYDVDVIGDINVGGVYRKGGIPGIDRTCAGGTFLQNPIVSGGIITGADLACVSSGGASNAWLLGGNTLSSAQSLGTLSAHNLSIIAGGAIERMLITTGGEIQIGTQDSTNEGAQVRFRGAGANRYFSIDNWAGTYRVITQDASGESVKFVIGNDGNVGIGTTAPTAKLEINGQIKITGGSPGLNKVLTSDANGLGSWQNSLAGGGLKTYVGATTGSYTGSGVGGYSGGDAKCVAQFGSGARMCMAADFVNAKPVASGWYNSFLNTLSRNEDAEFNHTYYEYSDCSGWTQSAICTSGIPGCEPKGPYWSSKPNFGACSASVKILCCQ